MQFVVNARIFSWLKESSLKAHIIKGAVGSFLIQIGFAVLSFLNAIILARLLGARDYGAYANAVAWVSILAVIATFGFDILIVRNVASYHTQQKFDELKGLLHFTERYVLIFSILLTLSFILVAKYFLFSQAEDIIRLSLWWGMPLIPLLTLININGATLRGFEHVIYARLPSMLIRPGLTLLGILAIYLVRPDGVSISNSMAVYIGSTIVALSIAFFWQRKFLPVEILSAHLKYEVRPWMKSAFFLVIFGSVQVLFGQIGTIMLGAMSTAVDVGLFSIASRLAYLLMFALVAVEMILAPVVARLNTLGECEKLQNILTQTVRIVFLVTLFPSLVLIFWGDHVLYIFGHEYAGGQTVLIILVFGQLINAATGSGAIVLFMLGYEQIVTVIFMTVTILSVALNAIIIPRYGLNGVASVSALSLIILNLLLSVFTVKRTGLHVTILGKFGWLI
jgi:O-antigen/teichoic acid export membrane protein